jgi:hypothetical protein
MIFRNKLENLVTNNFVTSSSKFSWIERWILMIVLDEALDKHEIFIAKTALNNPFELRDRTFFKNDDELKKFLQHFNITMDDLNELLLASSGLSLTYRQLFDSGVIKKHEFYKYLIDQYPDRVVDLLDYQIWTQIVKDEKLIFPYSVVCAVISLVIMNLISFIVDEFIAFLIASIVGSMLYLSYRWLFNKSFRNYKKWKRRLLNKLQQGGEDDKHDV